MASSNNESATGEASGLSRFLSELTGNKLESSLEFVICWEWVSAAFQGEVADVNNTVVVDVWQQYQELLEDHVLMPFNGNALCSTAPGGVILLTCGDGHKTPRFISELSAITSCPHSIQVNGGAVWIDPEYRDPFFSPAEHLVIVRFLVYQLVESMVLKGIPRGGPGVHLDCGKLAVSRKDVHQALEIAVRGKRHAKGLVPEIRKVMRQHCPFNETQLEVLDRVQMAPLAHIHQGDQLHIACINEDHPRFQHLRAVSPTQESFVTATIARLL